jgi:hypothetical protein
MMNEEYDKEEATMMLFVTIFFTCSYNSFFLPAKYQYGDN